MAAEFDSEMALFDTDRGLHPFWNRCFLCGTELDLDWPDLTELNPSDIKNHAHDEWRRAATGDCPFCSIIISVVDGAGIKYGCYVPDDYTFFFTGSLTGNDTKGFQVILERDESTGRYLLALELIWMPLLPKVEGQNEFWGTIAVYLDREGPDKLELNLEPFAEIPKHIDSPEGLKYVGDWLAKCQKDHPQCSHVPEGDRAMGAPSDASIRILQIHEDTLVLKPVELRGEIPPFIALSHCWGSGPTLTMSSTNIERFHTGIQVQDLPSTFKDAVKMTKWLGFDYIWIDSLCIMQDSRTDWEVQSSLMASVYGTAELVLAASNAASTEDGFLKGRANYRETSLQLSGMHNKGSHLHLRYRLLNPVDLHGLLNPLDLRAWALQERLLARRYLSVGTFDTTWACTTSLACECEWWRVASICRRETTSIERALRNKTEEEITRFWRQNVLRHYSRRGLTVPSDNLVAVSAIASVFQAKSGKHYYAGIWQGDLIPGLLWNAFLGRHTAYALDHSAPSWSWASLSTLNFRPIIDFEAIYGSENLARVLEIETTKSTTNKFGSVHSGFMKISGVIWTAEILASQLLEALPVEVGRFIKVQGYSENEFILHFDMSLIMEDVGPSDGAGERRMRRIRRKEVQEKFYIGNLRNQEVVHLLMIPLLKLFYLPNKSKKNMILGLILGKSREHPTKFERLGGFCTHNLASSHPRANQENFMGDFCVQEIIII